MKLHIKIVIVDYGVGNIHSVFNAISMLGYKNIKVSSSPQDILQADALVLPGVGAFDAAMKNLREKNLIPVLNEAVTVSKKSILGICLGMQLLTEGSDENGWNDGLGWIEGRIKKLVLPPTFAIPHVGWNEVIVKKRPSLFDFTPSNIHFYFDHSYHYEGNEDHVAGVCNYGITIAAAIQKGNICGVQFHPEKSQASGLRLFRSFFNSVSAC